jgi:hypothetical protein
MAPRYLGNDEDLVLVPCKKQSSWLQPNLENPAVQCLASPRTRSERNGQITIAVCVSRCPTIHIDRVGLPIMSLPKEYLVVAERVSWFLVDESRQ